MKRRGKTTRKGNHKGSNGSILYAIGIIALVALILVAGYFYFTLQGDPHDEANCPKTGPKAYLGVILDLTDPLNLQQSERLKKKLEQFLEEVEIGTLIAIGVVHSDSAQQGNRISICKPKSGKEANQLYENKSLLEGRYQESFEQPLRQTLQSMINAEEQPLSPIIESITSLVANNIGIVDKNIPKTLVIVSDLVQNSEVISFFRGEDWDDFTQTREFSNLSNILRGFDIYIIRTPPPQSGSFSQDMVDDFWIRYLELQPVKSIRLDKTTLGEI